ncbi:Glutaredoxin-C6 [Dendrobium catenatum]|uniref:Glutaredoxin-C6 n=1 Tax=Dendrobium catenatum TaxID=906689 RepID=A0A2I0XCZ8_9ASPA|nr:Glutaredoxin-C6 [Dendrobium catenatum]
MSSALRELRFNLTFGEFLRHPLNKFEVLTLMWWALGLYTRTTDLRDRLLKIHLCLLDKELSLFDAFLFTIDKREELELSIIICYAGPGGAGWTGPLLLQAEKQRGSAAVLLLKFHRFGLGLLANSGDGSEIQAALAQWTGQRTVPNVFISGNHIGGCDNVMEKHNGGKLVPLLTESGALAASAST